MPIAPIIATDKTHLRALVLNAIKTNGANCDLNGIDVSQVTDMSSVFYKTSFVGDISKWDTSRVKNFSHTFQESAFNSDISNWDTSNAVVMQNMFNRSGFNGDLSKWNVEHVRNTSEMFKLSLFSSDLASWQLQALIHCKDMFKDSSFQGRMPNIPADQMGYLGAFPNAYEGGMNNYYSLAHVLLLFKFNKTRLNTYLEKTFPKKIDRVHIEKILTLQTRPKWCTDKALFVWTKHQQEICAGLGLSNADASALLVQQFQNIGASKATFDMHLDMEHLLEFDDCIGPSC